MKLAQVTPGQYSVTWSNFLARSCGGDLSPLVIPLVIPRRKGGGGYGNSLHPSFRPTFLSAAYLQKYLRYQLQTSQVDRSH